MKKIIITGATDGLGLQTAKSLAKLGHNLVIHGRSAEKLKIAKSELMGINQQIIVDTLMADLSDITASKELADQIVSEHSDFDVLINNAGLYKAANNVLASGLDVRVVVNTLAPFILMQTICEKLTGKNIINLSSAAQHQVNLEQFTGEVKYQDDFAAYAQSKSALILVNDYFANTTANNLIAINPGSYLQTKIIKDLTSSKGNDIMIGVNLLLELALNDISELNGKYYDNDMKKLMPGYINYTKDEEQAIIKTIKEMI